MGAFEHFIHCNTLQHTATHCNTLQHTATHCNTLQHTATHCNTLQQAGNDEAHDTSNDEPVRGPYHTVAARAVNSSCCSAPAAARASSLPAGECACCISACTPRRRQCWGARGARELACIKVLSLKNTKALFPTKKGVWSVQRALKLCIHMQMYRYVWIHVHIVFMYICTHACSHADIFVCRLCLCVYAHTHIHVQIYVCVDFNCEYIHTYIYTHANVYACRLCSFIYTHNHIHTIIYTQSYTHNHIHMQIHICVDWVCVYINTHIYTCKRIYV